MQMTNGAIRSPNNVFPSSTKTNFKEAVPELDLDTFDLSAFVMPKPGSTAQKGTKAVAEIKQEVIQQFLAESDALFNMGQKYETEVVARGHQSLYELLASIYSLALRIENHDESKKIVSAIRKHLKDAFKISIQANSTPLAAVVRFVVRGDKVTASRYTKVLDIARKENLQPEDLPAYIKRRGGVTQIQDTEANQLAKKGGDKSSKERTQMIRELFNWMAIASPQSIDYAGQVAVHIENKDDKSDEQKSEFCLFVTQRSDDGTFKIISANDVGKAYEDNLVKFLGKNMPNDLHTLERGLRNYKMKLSQDESLSAKSRKQLERELAQPVKYKNQQVIEMDPSTENKE